MLHDGHGDDWGCMFSNIGQKKQASPRKSGFAWVIWLGVWRASAIVSKNINVSQELNMELGTCSKFCFFFNEQILQVKWWL